MVKILRNMIQKHRPRSDRIYKSDKIYRYDNNKTYKTINVHYPRIVVIDNDECLGQFGVFSILCNIVKADYYLSIDLNIFKRACAKYLFPSIVRPNTRFFFNLKRMSKMREQSWGRFGQYIVVFCGIFYDFYIFGARSDAMRFTMYY